MPCHTLSLMTRHSVITVLLTGIALAAPVHAQLKTGPALPQGLVENWPQLPKGWNFGEVSGVDVDRHDNVWVFHRGQHPVMQFDKHGKLLQAWNDVPVKSSHGIRLDPDGNVWLVDVLGHQIMKMSQDGRVQMVGQLVASEKKIEQILSRLGVKRVALPTAGNAGGAAAAYAAGGRSALVRLARNSQGATMLLGQMR